MADERSVELAAKSACPWCSAELPGGAAACPSCGAILVGEAESTVPGLTAVDPAAITRSRLVAPARKSRLLSWISGDDYPTDEDKPATPGSLAPPPPEVRREMLRIELQAEVTNLQAEADSMVAEAEAEAREHGRLVPTHAPDGPPPGDPAADGGPVEATGESAAADAVPSGAPPKAG